MPICWRPWEPRRGSESCASCYRPTLRAWWLGEIAEELGSSGSSLSHHLDKLKNEELVSVKREGTFLRYSANTGSLQELLGFLFAECCTRNQAIEPESIVQIAK